MSSRSPRTSGRRATRQPVIEDSYPHLPEPSPGHFGHLLAFVSVLAVLVFGVWTAFSTLTAPEDKSPAKAAPTAGTAMPVAAAIPTAAPTATLTRSTTPTPSASPTPMGARVHVVGQGDTLYRIAQRYGTTVEAIMAANNFSDRSRIIHIGDRLTIP